MQGYVDLYVLPVPKKIIPLYRKISSVMGKIMRSHGCLNYREFMGDDFNAPHLSPLTLVKIKKGEVLVFAVTEFRTKAHRNQVLKKVMADPRVKKICSQPMPFDHSRMVYGGFKTIVKA